MAEHESEAILGKGSHLRLGNQDGPPETFTDIAEVVKVPVPSGAADDVEVTHQDSPDNEKEYIAGLITPKEMSFDCNFIFDHATHDATTGLLALKASGAKRNWQVALPGDVMVFAFRAFVKDVEIDLDPASKISAKVTLKRSGGVTIT